MPKYCNLIPNVSQSTFSVTNNIFTRNDALNTFNAYSLKILVISNLEKAGKTKRKVIGETLLGSKEEKPEETPAEEAAETPTQEPETPTQESAEESAETVQSLSQHSINKCITIIILNPSNDEVCKLHGGLLKGRTSRRI